MADVRRIEQAAADWLARRDSGSWSAQDEAALQDWLSSIDNRVEFLRLEAAWREANRLKALGAGVPRGSIPQRGEWQGSPFFERSSSSTDSSMSERTATKRAVLVRAGAWAAAAAAMLVVVSLLLLRDGVFDRGRYFTPIGGLASIPVADGSNITLNTDSEIRVAFTEKERRIELARGEAFFDVAADQARPFVVAAGAQRVVAVGTRFSVRRLDDEADQLSVMVIEGRVRLERAGVQSSELTAGTTARIDGDGVLIEERQLPEVEDALSWRTGFLIFRETPLELAAAEFNRYSARKLVIGDPRVADIRIGGHFRSTNVDALVRLLENNFPIHAERRGDEIVLGAALDESQTVRP